MILVTITHRNGIAFDSPKTIAIDPEKIVDTKINGSYCVMEYGETYDRRRQPIEYQVTVSKAVIDALITGTYAGHKYLTLTVIASNTDIYKPNLDPTYTLELQERYIVDIRSTYIWINQTKTACSRIEFVPGAFVPVIIWVSEDISELITDVAGEGTTTTEEPSEETTTTESEEITTTTCAPRGDFVITLGFASSYDPTVGDPVSFLDSEQGACDAIGVINGQGGTFNYFEVDIYYNGRDNECYLHGTCDQLPTGYYVFDMDGLLGCHVTDGLTDEYDICSEITTTSEEPSVTTTTEPEFTTTTSPGY